MRSRGSSLKEQAASTKRSSSEGEDPERETRENNDSKSVVKTITVPRNKEKSEKNKDNSADREDYESSQSGGSYSPKKETNNKSSQNREDIKTESPPERDTTKSDLEKQVADAGERSSSGLEEKADNIGGGSLKKKSEEDDKPKNNYSENRRGRSRCNQKGTPYENIGNVTGADEDEDEDYKERRGKEEIIQSRRKKLARKLKELSEGRDKIVKEYGEDKYGIRVIVTENDIKSKNKVPRFIRNKKN